jgi:precorrin isomerase
MDDLRQQRARRALRAAPPADLDALVRLRDALMEAQAEMLAAATWIGVDDPVVVNALRRARERALAALGLDLEGNLLDP